MVAHIILFALFWAGQSQARSVLPPALDPEMWMLPSYSNHSSVDEWMRCHGMPCDVYERATRKLMLIKIGANGGDMYQDPWLITIPELLADDSLDNCIWLNEEQVDRILADMKREKIIADMESENERHSRNKRKVIDFEQFPRNMWPENEPVHWKFDGDHDALEQDMIRRGFEEWSEHTCLRFRELGVNENFDSNHILVTEKNSGCHSYVGRQDWWPQQLNLQSGCIFEVGIPIHEIGHAMGLWHEQQRADRDSVISINIDNVQDWLKGQFTPIRSLRSLGVPYDTTSVMHYKHRDGSVNGMSVMETHDPLYQYNMGQRTGLSFADAKIINRAYCAESCVNELPCERGGYTDPNDCSKCKCPDGYGGTRCEKAADPVGADCGGDFFLNDGDALTITSPGYDTVGAYDNFQECSWVFKTGSGYRPNVEFIEDFRLHCHYQDVCYHWVELKYENSSEGAGPRFCCSRKPSASITSQTDEMAIIFKSPWRNNDDRDRRGFKAIITAVSTTLTTPTTTPTTTTTTTATTTTTTTTPTTTTTTTPTTTTIPTTTTPTNANTTTTTTTTPLPPIECEKMDLIFMLDSSGSVMKANWAEMITFVQLIAWDLAIGASDIRVGVISFGNNATTEIGLDDYDEKYALLSAIGRVQWKDEWTNTPAALRRANYEFLRTPRADARKVALMITDGEANIEPQLLPVEAHRLRGNGVETFVIGVGANAAYGEAEIIAGSHLNIIPVLSFESLLAAMNDYSRLVRSRICETMDPEIGEDFEWSCDLERADGTADFCGMVQVEKDDQFDWTLMSGSTPSSETGPAGASVGNYYMYIEASNPRTEGDKAIITLPLEEREGLMCLTFDYSMYGFHTGALKVVIVKSSGGYGPIQWALAGEQGSEWKPAIVQVTLGAGEQIGIIGVRGAEYSGDTAVDNIRVVGGPCLG